MLPSPASGPPAGPHADTEFHLLDLGDGRQLARLGSLVVDRPYPAAVGPPGNASAWSAADLRFERDRLGEGEWSAAGEVPASWQMRHDDLVFELRPTPSGQVGFFPEQIEPWAWLAPIVAAMPGARVINLFAYTGGSTLVASRAGAAVTHVDAARSSVAWARRNAELSGLSAAPIRWIVDDALDFARRELRRGRRYDGIILDPPSYGHGPAGQRWTLEEHLTVLLDVCVALLEPEPLFVLLTAHAEGLAAEDLAAALVGAFARAGRVTAPAGISFGNLSLHAESGRSAPAGVLVRWQRQ